MERRFSDDELTSSRDDRLNLKDCISLDEFPFKLTEFDLFFSSQAVFPKNIQSLEILRLSLKPGMYNFYHL